MSECMTAAKAYGVFAPMSSGLSQEWVKALEHQVFPQIDTLLLNDAYF